MRFGKSIKYRLIEFFVFDYDTLPDLLSLFFWSGVIFPLVALDKIYKHHTSNVVCQSHYILDQSETNISIILKKMEKIIQHIIM